MKVVRDLFHGNCELPKCELEDKIKKWKNVHAHGLWPSYLIFYIFNAISIKIQMVLSKDLYQSIIKFVWNYKIPQIANIILKNKKGGISQSKTII